MINWSIGKKNRIRRLIDVSGAILAVPMDHGYSIGVSKGLENMNQTVNNVSLGGASCAIMQRGIVRSVNLPHNIGLMVHVSGSTSRSSKPNFKIPTGSVEDTIRLGADGISCHVNIGHDDDAKMLRDMSLLSEQSDKYEFPLMAMMYMRDNDGNDDLSVGALSHLARVAEEAGADIVKVNATTNGEKFDEVTQGIEIPIVVAGGAKKDDFSGFLNTIRKCILDGAVGVSIGRNIFQAENQQIAMQKVTDAVRAAAKEVGNIEILS